MKQANHVGQESNGKLEDDSRLENELVSRDQFEAKSSVF